MTSNIDEMEKIARVAKVEEIVSTLKSGTIPFQMFALFVTNDKDGRELRDELETAIEKIDMYVGKAIVSRNLDDKLSIYESMLADYSRKIEDNGKVKEDEEDVS